MPSIDERSSATRPVLWYGLKKRRQRYAREIAQDACRRRRRHGKLQHIPPSTPPHLSRRGTIARTIHPSGFTDKGTTHAAFLHVQGDFRRCDRVMILERMLRRRNGGCERSGRRRRETQAITLADKRSQRMRDQTYSRTVNVKWNQTMKSKPEQRRLCHLIHQ
jgi:hypothetical protein